ncbi:WD40-repeat-containing domain protein [Suillus paluster]|uniref:WD40-repeat-containing domain protein n=1 Tax=Suillus paluster TaxID=48578 RepID=UPI001B87B7EF|nr:WD40-repeat-containing domain protein [Suillus paluster]KAG1730113.1 WD40-repeat-containing domain protein [Suillus paluster]
MSAATSHDKTSSKPPQTDRDTLGGHALRAWCVAAFPDSERVVSVSDDDTVVVWKFRTKEQEHRWAHKGATTVAVSRDGKKVASGGRDCALQLWDAESGQRLAGPWKVHKQRVWSVSWSPNGNHIASCPADSFLIIWDVHSGEPILDPLLTEQKAVYTVAYSPNGEKVATGGQDFTIKIWDALTMKLQATLSGHTMTVSSVAWTRDGSKVISGSVDCTVRIWDIIEKKEVCPAIQAHSHAVNYIAVSEHVFATASVDHAYLWNLKTRQCLHGPFELSKSDEANCVALSEDEGTIAACTERGRLYTWNIGKITSAIITGDAEDIQFSDIGDITEPGYDVSEDFFGPHESHHSQPQNGNKVPVKRGFKQQFVALSRAGIPRGIVPRNISASRGRPAAVLNKINETEDHHNRGSATIRTKQSAAGQGSQGVTTTESGPGSQPSSPTTSRERFTWARLWAAVLRLLKRRYSSRHG